ncbi:MAG: MurR/RpiR family transcriptional regulator [Mesorhizobium sp.]
MSVGKKTASGDKGAGKGAAGARKVIERKAPAQSMAPATTYEALVNTITAEYPRLSERYQQVARFVTQNPNVIGLESINAIAGRCGMHPSILVRFAQKFGYSGFKELQLIFQDRLATAAPGFQERINAVEIELKKNVEPGFLGYLRNQVVRDIATLQTLLETISEESLERAAVHLRDAEIIYIAGQHRSAPIALFAHYVLTMLRRRVILLDAPGGLATEVASTMGSKDVLIAIAFRHYAKEVVTIAENAAANGTPVLAITDSQLSPLSKDASVLFTVPEEEYTFALSLAAPMSLVQTIATALASLLQQDGSNTSSPARVVARKAVSKRSSILK